MEVPTSEYKNQIFQQFAFRNSNFSIDFHPKKLSNEIWLQWIEIDKGKFVLQIPFVLSMAYWWRLQLFVQRRGQRNQKMGPAFQVSFNQSKLL